MKQEPVTVCYVLTDDSFLRYTKQLLISLSSLRFRNPEVFVCIFTDDSTARVWPVKYKRQFEKLRAEVSIIHIPDSYSPMEKSRYLKTSLRKYITGSILYLDTDTVIADTFTLDELTGDIMFAHDANYDPAVNGKIPGGLVYDLDGHRELAREYGYPFNETDEYFNGGVFWVKDNKNTRFFFEKWHEEWEKGRSKGLAKDQPSLNYINQEMGRIISPLEDTWNVQIHFANSLRFISSAKVIHYLVSIREEGVFMPARHEIMELEPEDELIQAIIRNPKESFVPFRLTTLSPEQISVTYSSIFRTAVSLYRDHRFAFRCINYLFSIKYRLAGVWNKTKDKG